MGEQKWEIKPRKALLGFIGVCIGFFLYDIVINLVYTAIEYASGGGSLPTETVITPIMEMSAQAGIFVLCIIVLLALMVFKKFMSFVTAIIIGVIGHVALIALGFNIPDVVQMAKDFFLIGMI